MSLIKAIIFDMDGLIIDSERLYFQAERMIAARFNKVVQDTTLGKMMGRTPIEGMDIFVKDLGLPVNPQDVLIMRTDLMRNLLNKDLVIMPGFFHILGTFQNRLDFAVCTGAQREFLDLVVNRLCIRDRFRVFQTSEGIDIGKPDPEIFLETCRKLGTPPQKKCIVLEDSSNGALAGRRAGCIVIAVPSEYTKGQDFSFIDLVAADLYEAAKIIGNLTSL
jgi:HAD superfamily hydrolase (TIGR01509 family)